jgi:hypothetical protein
MPDIFKSPPLLISSNYISKGNRDAENYYKNTQLENGEIASNPRYFFMEAAAEYLGHRAVEYYSALDRLSRAANGEIPHDQLKKWIEDTRKQYDNAIKTVIIP